MRVTMASVTLAAPRDQDRQLAPKAPKLAQFLVYFVELLREGLLYATARTRPALGQSKYLPDLCEGQSERLCLANESHAPDLVRRVQSIPCFGPLRRRDELFALVVVERLNADPKLPRCVACKRKSPFVSARSVSTSHISSKLHPG